MLQQEEIAKTVPAEMLCGVPCQWLNFDLEMAFKVKENVVLDRYFCRVVVIMYCSRCRASFSSFTVLLF